MSIPLIENYLVALIPNAISNISASNKTIVDELKISNLYMKIINFHHQLLVSNQRISEGKDSCPVYITWELNPAYTIPGITCGQVRYLLRNMKINQNFGKVVELSCKYLQALKFKHNYTSNNLVYNSELL